MTDELPTPSFESEEVFEIPPRPVRDIAMEAIADVDESIAALLNWGVKIRGDSRLHKARGILQHALDTDVRQLAPKHRGDHLGLRALELAFDFSAITDTLPAVPLAALRRDLRDSLSGDLDPPEVERGPSQLQSQAMVRAAYVRGKVFPIHPTHSSNLGISSPDLVLENGSQRYAIEAKRPQFLKNVGPRLEDACEQLAGYGLPGGVLVDVTDCLRDTPQPELSTEIRKIALGLYDRVFVNGRGHRPGYDHIMAAGAYARLAWTSDDDDERMMVNVHTSSVIGIFAPARNTLVDIRARWIRSRFQEGLRRLNLTLSEGDSPSGTS